MFSSGGTPCQSYSLAGLRAGLDDPRGNLTLTYVAIARKYRPSWVVWENVPGVLSSNKGRDFGSFLGLLTGQHIEAPPTGWKNSGIIPGYKGAYGIAWRVLDAQHFGVPQRRRRVFVVGYLGDWRRAAAVLFERHGLQGNPPPRKEAGAIITPTIRAGASNGGKGHGARSGDSKDELIVPVSFTPGSHGAYREGIGTLRSNGGDLGGGSEDLVCMSTGQASAEIGIGIGTTLNCNHDAPIIAGTLCVGGKGSGSATQQDAHQGLLIAHTLRGEGFDASEDGSGRGTPLTPGGSAVRRLTPRECERLQGFPDDHTRIPERYFKERKITKNRPADRWERVGDKWALMTADGPRYKAIGNSMAVPVMAWIGKRIQAVSTL